MLITLRSILCAILFLFPAFAAAQPVVLCCGQQPEAKAKPEGGPVEEKQYGRGRVVPTAAMLTKRHADSYARHDSRNKLLPVQTDPSFDCVSKGWTSPVADQANCGSCWIFIKVTMESAYIKAGYGKDFRLSAQYVMDCKSSSPCNGGDEYDVAVLGKQSGLPQEADYYPYEARVRTCRPIKNNGKLMKIGDFGFCTPSQQQGIAAVQDIKNAMVQHGMISVAVDASRFNSYSGGVLTGTGHNIDHAVNLVGWDDSKAAVENEGIGKLGGLPRTVSKGAWKLQNQWGTGWGVDGFMWIAYGAYDVGTEAIWVSVAELPPPPPPPPVVTAPVITSALTATATIGQRFTYTITATNNPTSYGLMFQPDWLKISGATITGTPTASGNVSVTIMATNSAGTTAKALEIAIGSTPPPIPTGKVVIELTPAQVADVLKQAGVTHQSYTVTIEPDGTIKLTPATMRPKEKSSLRVLPTRGWHEEPMLIASRP